MGEIQEHKDVVYECTYRVVWCSKYRRNVIDGDVGNRLKEIAHEVCRERDARIVRIVLMPDYVDMVVTVDPQLGIHRLVKQIKGQSSRLLRQEYPALRSRLPTLWTNSYFVATIGVAPIDIVKEYIESQPRT